MIPIKTKMLPVIRLITLCGMVFPRRVPAAMDNAEAAIKARVAETKILILLISGWVEKRKVVMLVLSPSSAKKTVIKIKKKTFRFKN